jgi:hypothetical protein
MNLERLSHRSMPTVRQKYTNGFEALLVQTRVFESQ